MSNYYCPDCGKVACKEPCEHCGWVEKGNCYRVSGICLVPCEVSIDVTAKSPEEAVKKALSMRWQNYICNGYDDTSAFDWNPSVEEIKPIHDR